METKKLKADLAKEKIKKAAAKLMAECENASEVTTRAIAKEAGVQLAMVNYYFGSREELLFCLFQDLSREQFQECPQVYEIIKSECPPKDKLKKIHFYMITMMLDNYVYMQAVLGHVLLHRDLSQGLNSLPFVIEHYKGRKTEQECKLISYEMSSTMQLAVYRHEALKEFCGLNLLDEVGRKKFVDEQIDLFLKD
ncbi:MAG: TetR/AcrR family transcriptional regulator [Lachnospiraceae bacterium]|nr:TetR/AcrR family transcriptional regulator [Lachnospiraceae bacterium]